MMDNDRFFNAYVEILTNTFHDALNKNIVFQAQAKVTGEDVEAFKSKINELQNTIQQQQDVENILREKDNELVNKNAELGRLKNDYEHAKNESNHLNTFKNELVSARQELQNKIKEIQELNVVNEREKQNIRNSYELQIKDLQQKIEYLQMTPAQRRKFDAKNVAKEEKVIENKVSYNPENSNDGGVF